VFGKRVEGPVALNFEGSKGLNKWHISPKKTTHGMRMEREEEHNLSMGFWSTKVGLTFIVRSPN